MTSENKFSYDPQDFTTHCPVPTPKDKEDIHCLYAVVSAFHDVFVSEEEIKDYENVVDLWTVSYTTVYKAYMYRIGKYTPKPGSTWEGIKWAMIDRSTKMIGSLPNSNSVRIPCLLRARFAWKMLCLYVGSS